jgi:cell division protein FtsB
LRRIVAIGVTLIAVYLLLLTGQRALDAYRLRREAEALRQDIITLRTRNIELQRELASDRRDLEVERVAREQLGYARPGDHPIVLMWTEDPRRPAVPPPRTREQDRPVWQEWINLFVDTELAGK